jgi:hypothetical protein
MNNEILTAKQVLEVASSQWATVRDIMILGSVGRNKANMIRSEIATLIYGNDSKVRNRGLVPMAEVLKYFNIDINYLKEVATYGDL